VLDDILPLSVPVVSNYALNDLLLGELRDRGLRSRMGIVFTTANRNWELHLSAVEDWLRVSRALAVDMESATVAANGFRYRVPTATLLAVSDKPLHALPKLNADAQEFYTASRRQHVEVAISVADKVRRLYPGGLPTAELRSSDEPLFGLTSPEVTPNGHTELPSEPRLGLGANAADRVHGIWFAADVAARGPPLGNRDDPGRHQLQFVEEARDRLRAAQMVGAGRLLVVDPDGLVQRRVGVGAVAQRQVARSAPKLSLPPSR
jgi:hypothetical protein